MNTQTNQPTEQASKAAVTPPEITALGSQEAVAANILEIFEPKPNPEITQVQTIEIKPDGQPATESLSDQALMHPQPAQITNNNPLANPLDPVIEQEAPSLRDPASTADLHKDVQRMVREGQFAGAEQEVTHERLEHTKNISLS